MYAKGVSWIGDTRIPFVDDGDKNSACNKNHEQGKYNTDFFDGYFKRKGSNTKGRFTPNLLVCDDMLNDGSITKQSKRTYKPTDHKGSLFGNSSQGHGEGIGDKGTNSRYYSLDLWFNKMINNL
jgi:hypothetical protein